jgi:3'(2'), 5'-bisphosphate nucleotidase
MPQRTSSSHREPATPRIPQPRSRVQASSAAACSAWPLANPPRTGGRFREYGESPRAGWAVHVALAVNGRPTAGAVALPAADLVLHTGEPPAVAPAAPGPTRLAVSRTRPPACVGHLLARLNAALVPMGSAGAKAMAVIRGEVDVYAHSGGQYERDSCVPVAVAAAAGLHVSRLDGSPLRYNEPDPYLLDLLVCRPELAGVVLDALRNP